MPNNYDILALNSQLEATRQRSLSLLYKQKDELELAEYHKRKSIEHANNARKYKKRFSNEASNLSS